MEPVIPAVSEIASEIAAAAAKRQWRVMTAESCTGGMVAAALTDAAGASEWFCGGAVCYSNGLKRRMLNVPAAVLDAHGAVSEETAAAMCAGLTALGADAGVSVTGIAGPGGGSADKPVGTVCFGICAGGAPATTCTQRFEGDRAAVRAAATLFALRQLAAALAAPPPQ